MVERNRLERRSLQDEYDRLPDEIKAHGARMSFALGCAVVKTFLGTDWFSRHVMPSARKKGVLTIDESDPRRFDLSAYRIVDLAELLYNLQNVSGFDECIARMRDGDIEGTYAELDLGRMLYLYSIQFRYVIPQGQLGFDYDVEIVYSSGQIACADAKCKIEATKFTAKTIRHTLDKARGQLPDDRPGIVFVKVPPRWVGEPNFLSIACNTARAFFHSTRRVVSVKFYVPPVRFENDGLLRVEHAYREISNPVTDFGSGVNWDIFYETGWNGTPPHWQRILFFPDGNPR